jgi:hypothetical protein
MPNQRIFRPWLLQRYVRLRRDLRGDRKQRLLKKTSALQSVSCATEKGSRLIEKMLVNCTSSGVLTRIESDPSRHKYIVLIVEYVGEFLATQW